MTTLAPVRTFEQWVKHLNGQWDEIRETAVLGFIQLGNDLWKAKDDVEHGDWLILLEQLHFNRKTANIFMRIAESKMAVTDRHLLPPDYNTIDKLIRLDEGTFNRLKNKGVICPTVQRNEVQRILNNEKVQADEKRVLELRPRPGKYRTIVVDPAWEYDAFSKGAVAGKIGKYARQSFEDLWNLDLRKWADDECHLYCWATNAYVLKAGALVEHWGFEYKQLLTWIKPPPFGLGRNYRNSTEQVLFAMVGERTTRVNNLPTHFEGARGEHSEKPESFYDIVRQASYPPHGEANQRKFRPDFTDLFMSGEPLQAAV